MGLREKRAIEQFKDNQFPNLQNTVRSTAGFDVEMEVAWDQLAAENYDHLYDEAIPKVYFEPLNDALAAIATDDMGKDALRAGLKKVVIANEDNQSNPDGFRFEGGVLTINHSPVANIDDVHKRKDKIQELLEGAL